MGDNLHQRAVIRQLCERETVYLETPWPSVYHDLVGDRLRLVNKNSPLRTQAKNAAREAGRYHSAILPVDATTRHIRVWYAPAEVRACGSVLGAMMKATGTDIAKSDFRLPVPDEWLDRSLRYVPDVGRPILYYRPLMERTEWNCRARNPDHGHYAALARAIRDRFFVVSIGDFEKGREWAVGSPLAADMTFHRGEIEFEALAALVKRSALVFASPGFSIPLAQAVGTPSICVFGGYENSRSFSAGAKFAPYLGIDTLRPCQCFSHSHACDKRIDVAGAIVQMDAFIESQLRSNEQCASATYL